MTGFEPVLQLWDSEYAVVILKSLSPRWESNPQIPDPKSGPFANLVTRRHFQIVPALVAATSFSDFQSGPITGFGLAGIARFFSFPKK